MLRFTDNHMSGSFRTLLILFILEMLTLPAVIMVTYGDMSGGFDHMLEYRDHGLKWDRQTSTDSSGSAHLLIFDEKYRSVSSSDESSVVAPGTKGSATVRLINREDETVHYTAVIYSCHDRKELPVRTSVTGRGLSDTEDIVLPDGVQPDDVVRSVSGELERADLQDIVINWQWEFSRGNVGDIEDTQLGEDSAEGDPDRITTGIYVTAVSEDGSMVTPSPQTGDSRLAAGYAALTAVSGILLILLYIRRKNGESDEQG